MRARQQSYADANNLDFEGIIRPKACGLQRHAQVMLRAAYYREILGFDSEVDILDDAFE